MKIITLRQFPELKSETWVTRFVTKAGKQFFIASDFTTRSEAWSEAELFSTMTGLKPTGQPIQALHEKMEA